MPVPPYRRPFAGEPLSGHSARRVLRDVEQLSDVSGTGDLSVSEGGGQRQVLDGRPKSFPGRIVANVTANFYSFIRVDDGRGDGTFPDLEGTTEEGDGAALVAWELNGRDDVEPDTLVHLWQNLLGAGFTFVAPAGSTGGSGSSSAGCAWPAGLLSTDCLELTVISATGRCADIDTTQILALVWDIVNEWWESTGTFYHIAGDGPVIFWYEDGRARMTIDGVEGTLVGCGDDFADFAFGGASLCNVDGPCGPNTFTVRVACACCPADGWTLPGWYCTAESDCVLLDVPACDGDYTITSGPHDTEDDCMGICGGGPATSCPCIAGDTLHVAISNVSGCAGAAGVAVTLARGAPLPGPLPNPSFSLSSAPGGGGCGNVTDCSYNCETRQFSIVFGADNTNLIPVVLALDSCSPFQASGDVALTFSSDETCCTGTIHVVVTE